MKSVLWLGLALATLGLTACTSEPGVEVIKCHERCVSTDSVAHQAWFGRVQGNRVTLKNPADDTTSVDPLPLRWDVELTFRNDADSDLPRFMSASIAEKGVTRTMRNGTIQIQDWEPGRLVSGLVHDGVFGQRDFRGFIFVVYRWEEDSSQVQKGTGVQPVPER